MTKDIFDHNDIEQGWVPPLSNDKSLLELKVRFFQNHGNQTMKYVISTYEDFISSFEKAIENNESFTVSGLENFNQKDVIVGCNHFLDELIMTHGLESIQHLGGYGYYKKLDPRVKHASVDTLVKGKPLILEYPFPKYGGEHKDHKAIMKKCNDLEIDVYLDCAWLPTSWDIHLDLNEPCIKGLAMSLSKCYGLHWSRIGVRWLRNEKKDSIWLQNKHRMVSFASVMLGKYYLDRLPIDYLVKKYKQRYYEVCDFFNHKPGNTIMISHSHDNEEIYGIAKCLIGSNEKN